MRVAAFICLALVVVSCTTERDSIDPYPLSYDYDLDDDGLVIVRVSREGSTRNLALVDILSPLTVLDTFEVGQPLPTQGRRTDTLIMHGETAGAPVARFRFPNTQIFDIHFCGDETDYCRVGSDAQTRAVGGLVGFDLLRRNALRIDFPARELYMFPDIAGTSEARGDICDAVFSAPFAGGGTLLIGGAEVRYSAGRLAMGVCVNHEITGVGTDAPSYDGVDLLLLVSTAVVPTILSESAYQRYYDNALRRGQLPVDLMMATSKTVHLPSGPVTGLMATVPKLALVGEASDLRGPCKELFTNHMMSTDECTTHTAITNAVCPCNGSRFCRAGSAVEIDQESGDEIEVVVVSDVTPILQALRNELRPSLPEADGILGVGALADLSLDLDYPNNRVLARCAPRVNATDPITCTTRPEVRNRDALAPIALCLSSLP